MVDECWPLPVIITVTPGGDIAHDILMQGSAIQKAQWYGATSYASPIAVPRSGSWAGTLSGYGSADFFQFSAQANRTLSVIVNAVDSSSNTSESKAMPVAGMWGLGKSGSVSGSCKYIVGFRHLVFRRDAPRRADSAKHNFPPRHCGLSRRQSSGLSLHRTRTLW